MADELEGRIDALYALPLDRFTPERDALTKALQAAGDPEAAKRVKALRKPVVSAWTLNALAREDPEGIRELIELGTRLRDAQRRALSGGDVESLREATDERRRLVGRLTRTASAILERAGTSAGSHEGDLSSTLDAAAVDEESGQLLRSGRLTKPLQPPVSFGEPGLRVLEGGRGAKPAGASTGQDRSDERDREREKEVTRLRRELAEAERRERSAAAAADRARRRYEELEA
ncbi:MAG: hypothetical protein ACRDHC_09930, partial [Actinomycetota bacterium]